MGNLIKIDNFGNWCIKGVAWSSIYPGKVLDSYAWEKIYGCLYKLKYYESIGLSPDQVVSLIHKFE